MTETKRLTMRLDEITIPDDRRDQHPIDDLVASIREVGLLHPVVVRREGEEVILVAGMHRYRAFEAMKRKSIPVTVIDADDVDAGIATIDENLTRHDLTQLERSQQLARLKDLYEIKYPETKPGAKRAAEQAPTTPTFITEAARKAGRSERTMYRDVQIANKIEPDVQKRIKGTCIEDNKGELLKLAAMPSYEQRDIAERIASNQATSVSQAERQLSQAVDDAAQALSGPLPDPVTLTRREYAKLAPTLLRAMRGMMDLDPAQVSAGVDSTSLDILRRNRDAYVAWVDRVLAANDTGLRLVRQLEHV